MFLQMIGLIGISVTAFRTLPLPQGGLLAIFFGLLAFTLPVWLMQWLGVSVDTKEDDERNGTSCSPSALPDTTPEGLRIVYYKWWPGEQGESDKGIA